MAVNPTPTKRNNTLLAFFVITGLAVIGYMGFVVVSAFSSSPSASMKAPVARVADIPNAVLAGDQAVRMIGAKWDEDSLARAIDPSVHQTQWYLDLKKLLPVFKEDLGPIDKLAGSAAFKPRGEIDYYDYRGKFTCEKGSGSMRMLVVNSNGYWAVTGVEVSMDMPNIDKKDELGNPNSSVSNR